MFAYCGNNPVTGYDPTGEWDWGGFLVGLAIAVASVVAVAVSVVTCGAATPLVTGIAAPALATGGTIMYAAATESQMDVDYSGAGQT